MKYKPHPYQHQATRFIIDHPRCAIFLGMGLGKTIITLTALAELTHNRFETTKTLIIAPKRVAQHTWPQELQKWDHLQTLRHQVLVGTPTQRRKALAADAEIYITNLENVCWLVEELDRQKQPWPFDTIVLDELSAFKNHQAKRFKALKNAGLAATRIIGLTGTPAPNSLMDIWAPFRIIDGGTRLGPNITYYRNQYFYPAKTNGHIVYQYALKTGAEAAIYDAIADVTLSMKTRDYLQLPPVTYSNHPVTLSQSAQKAYQSLKKDLMLEIGPDHTIDAVNAASLMQKLQQLASGAIYTGEPGQDEYLTIHSDKLDALAEVVEQAAGNTILCAYWFKHERDRILQQYPHARDIRTPKDIADWNAGKIQLALIHPASAGHGLNLQTGGHLMVWFTTPWSLELYEQACARLDRQGQTEPVSIIHLVTEGTVDEVVQQALHAKSVGQQALIDAVKRELKK